jgi:CheY-like chemotaxis protein
VARILTVDDDEADRLFLRAVLESAGHDVFFARDGEEAVKTFMRRGIDLVVTDLQMPNVDGFDLMTVLGDFLPAPPIVVISGMPSEYHSQARFMGAAITLSKPVDPKVLLAAVDSALEGREL